MTTIKLDKGAVRAYASLTISSAMLTHNMDSEAVKKDIDRYIDECIEDQKNLDETEDIAQSYGAFVRIFADNYIAAKSMKLEKEMQYSIEAIKLLGYTEDRLNKYPQF